MPVSSGYRCVHVRHGPIPAGVAKAQTQSLHWGCATESLENSSRRLTTSLIPKWYFPLFPGACVAFASYNEGPSLHIPPFRCCFVYLPSQEVSLLCRHSPLWKPWGVLSVTSQASRSASERGGSRDAEETRQSSASLHPGVSLVSHSGKHQWPVIGVTMKFNSRWTFCWFQTDSCFSFFSPLLPLCLYLAVYFSLSLGFSNLPCNFIQPTITPFPSFMLQAFPDLEPSSEASDKQGAACKLACRSYSW